MTGNETQREASWVEGLTLQEQSGHWVSVRLKSLHWASLLDELQMIVIMGVKAAAVRPPHEAGPERHLVRCRTTEWLEVCRMKASGYPLI